MRKEDDELDEEGRAVRAEPLLRGGGPVGGERGGPQDGSKDTRGGRGAEGAAEEGALESLEVEDEAELYVAADGRMEELDEEGKPVRAGPASRARLAEVDEGASRESTAGTLEARS